MKNPRALYLGGIVLLAVAGMAVWLWLDSLSARHSDDTGHTDAAGRIEEPLTASAANPSGTAAAGAENLPKDGAAASLREPRGRWQTEVPKVEEYLALSPPAARDAYSRFQEDFPEFDPTQRDHFARASLARRATYPDQLDEQASAELTAWLEPMEEMQRALIAARAGHIGIPVESVETGGRHYTLIGFEGPRPLYITTQNVNAAKTTGANLVRLNAGYDPLLASPASGEGHYVNVNDHGTVYEHTEFQLPDNGGSRIVYTEVYDAGNRSHMTHVTGTVAAWGYNSSLIGMAPRLWIRSHIQQSNSDVTGYGMLFPGQNHTAINPRTGEAELKSIMGTTSLGWDLTNHNNCIYTSSSASFDTVLRDYPYYAHFFAASNNGSNYQTLGNDWPMSKNVFTIGSVSDVSRDADGNYISGGNVSSFSSRGPTFDGRIKPDLTANGDWLTSTDGANDTSNKSGTSMATPNASGSATLLMDYIFRKLPGHYVRSSTIKALLANTATDRGNAGPDYYYGWGIINVKTAADVVKRYGNDPASRVVIEDELSPNQTWTATYTYNGSGPIRATLAWIDPAGSSQIAGTTDRSPRLVNNLNLRLTSAGGTVYQPYVMPYTIGSGGTPAFDNSLFGAAAVTGDNVTDNVEQVFISAPPAGTYTLTVTHAGSLQNNNPQKFSLAVTGMAQAGPFAPVISSVTPASGNGTDNFPLTVSGSGFILGTDVILRRAGSPDTTAYAVIPVGSRIECRVDTSTMAKGYWDVVLRTSDGAETVLPNGFLLPVGSGGRTDLYTNDFESGATGFSLGTGWSLADPDKGSVGGPANAFEGSKALVTYAGGSYPSNVSTYVTLPAVSTLSNSSIQLSFHRCLGLSYNQSGSPSKRHADYGRIQYSTNNGVSWSTLYSSSSAMSDAAWSLQTYTLPADADNKSELRIRFQLQTDSSNNNFGWCIDDLRVSGITDSSLPPVFTSPLPGEATVGLPFNHVISVSDADTPGFSLMFDSSGLPAGLALGANGDGTATISGTPSTAGTFAVTVSVTDGAYTTYQIFDLVVQPGATNHPPVIVTESLPNATAGSAYSALVTATDEDNDVIALSIGSKPEWLGFTDQGDGTASLSGAPPVGSEGILQLEFLADDGADQTPKTLSLTILPKPNTAPQISAIADLTISANTATGALAFTIADDESDAAALIVSGTSSDQTLVPDGNIAFSGSGASRVVTVTPAANESGIAVITLTVSDGVLSAEEQFTLTVDPTYDSWIAHEQSIGGDTGFSADPDGDGVVNLLEYALGGSAGTSDVGQLPTTQLAVQGDAYHLELHVSRNSAAHDVDLIVEVSDDLGGWHSGPEHVTVVEETPDTLIVRDNTPVDSSGGRRFIRLRVVVPQ